VPGVEQQTLVEADVTAGALDDHRLQVVVEDGSGGRAKRAERLDVTT
jgi:hypothetical protein